MRIFIERFILGILAPLVLFIATTPMQISWWPTRIISIIGIVIVAGIAAYFAGWNEWRWERIRAVWWLWSIHCSRCWNWLIGKIIKGQI